MEPVHVANLQRWSRREQSHGRSLRRGLRNSGRQATAEQWLQGVADAAAPLQLCPVGWVGGEGREAEHRQRHRAPPSSRSEHGRLWQRRADGHGHGDGDGAWAWTWTWRARGVDLGSILQKPPHRRCWDPTPRTHSGAPPPPSASSCHPGSSSWPIIFPLLPRPTYIHTLNYSYRSLWMDRYVHSSKFIHILLSYCHIDWPMRDIRGISDSKIALRTL